MKELEESSSSAVELLQGKDGDPTHSHSEEGGKNWADFANYISKIFLNNNKVCVITKLQVQIHDGTYSPLDLRRMCHPKKRPRQNPCFLFTKSHLFSFFLDTWRTGSGQQNARERDVCHFQAEAVEAPMSLGTDTASVSPPLP